MHSFPKQSEHDTSKEHTTQVTQARSTVNPNDYPSQSSPKYTTMDPPENSSQTSIATEAPKIHGFSKCPENNNQNSDQHPTQVSIVMPDLKRSEYPYSDAKLHQIPKYNREIVLETVYYALVGVLMELFMYYYYIFS